MRKGPPSNHFPTKLHEMLDEAEDKGHSNVISWCPDGKSFRIHQPGEMVPVLSAYFRQTKFKSLLRQLQGYNFKRVTSGTNKGNVSHPLFVRGKRNFSMQMKRKQNIPRVKSQNNSPASIKSNKSKKESNKGLNPQACSRSAKSAIVDDSFIMLAPSRNAPLHPQAVLSNQSDLQKLQSSFKSSMNALMANQHQATTILPAPQHHQNRQRQQAVGMDALRVEIGCTFSSSINKNNRPKSASSSSFKRSAPLPNAVQSSASDPTFENGRLSKGAQQPRRSSFQSKVLSSTFKNASFPFSQQSQSDDILEEEKLQFEQLEKLCFSNFSQGPGTNQFHHSHHSSSAMGMLDLDISLTTTTTTTHHNGGGPQVSSSSICNKFSLEPTPIRSPSRDPSKVSSSGVNDGFTLSCDIGFPSQVDNKAQSVILKLPSAMMPGVEPTAECNSPESDSSLGLASEVSDEIDEGIAEAFSDHGNKNGWTDVTFDSDIEDDVGDKEDQDDWAKGIVYEGKTDCVLEPEKFQIEVQSLLSCPQQMDKSSQFRLEQAALQHRQAMMRGNANTLSRAIPVPQRRIIGLHQPQMIPMKQPPYALPTKLIPFQHLPCQIQQFHR